MSSCNHRAKTYTLVVLQQAFGAIEASGDHGGDHENWREYDALEPVNRCGSPGAQGRVVGI